MPDICAAKNRKWSEKRELTVQIDELLYIDISEQYWSQNRKWALSSIVNPKIYLVSVRKRKPAKMIFFKFIRKSQIRKISYQIRHKM